MSRLEELVEKWRKRVVNNCNGEGECCCHGKCAAELESALAAQPQVSEEQVRQLDEGAPTNAAYRIWNDLAEFIAFLGPAENKYKAIAKIQGRIVEMLNNEGVTQALLSAPATPAPTRRNPECGHDADVPCSVCDGPKPMPAEPAPAAPEVDLVEKWRKEGTLPSEARWFDSKVIAADELRDWLPAHDAKVREDEAGKWNRMLPPEDFRRYRKQIDAHYERIRALAAKPGPSGAGK